MHELDSRVKNPTGSYSTLLIVLEDPERVCYCNLNGFNREH